MSQLTGTEAYAPKNQLSIYNPDEFSPLVTEDSTAENLISIITDVNTLQTAEIGANTILYNAFASQFDSYIPAFSPGSYVDDVFYPIISASPTFPSVIGTNYVCNIAGSFASLSSYLNYVQIRLTDTSTSTVLINLYATASYNLDQTNPISFSKTFMFQGTGNQIAFEFLVNGPSSTIYAFIPASVASTYGAYAVTSPLLSILSIAS
jgi:hypothetical protein